MRSWFFGFSVFYHRNPRPSDKLQAKKAITSNVIMLFATVATWVRRLRNAPSGELHAEKAAKSDCVVYRAQNSSAERQQDLHCELFLGYQAYRAKKWFHSEKLVVLFTRSVIPRSLIFQGWIWWGSTAGLLPKGALQGCQFSLFRNIAHKLGLLTTPCFWFVKLLNTLKSNN